MSTRQTLPNHIAIIPDGNRRWALEHKLPTVEGHRRGFDLAVALARKTRELGIQTLTFWCFSTENWGRTKREVGYLMRLFERFVKRNLDEAIEESVHLTHFGRKDRLSRNLLKLIREAEKKTKHFTKYYLNIALDYGGRDEIIRAIQKSQISNLKSQTLSEADFSKLLDTGNLPQSDPDIIIRTGKENRLSGFMLWQSAYSELFFPDDYFPDFGPDKLEAVVKEYIRRQRRFGK